MLAPLYENATNGFKHAKKALSAYWLTPTLTLWVTSTKNRCSSGVCCCNRGHGSYKRGSYKRFRRWGHKEQTVCRAEVTMVGVRGPKLRRPFCNRPSFCPSVDPLSAAAEDGGGGCWLTAITRSTPRAR